MLHLVLPWPPSLNRIWRVFGKRIILSKAARAYHRAAAAALPRGRVPKPFTGPLSVVLVMHPPAEGQQKQRWDIANREKCLCDALTKQRVWLDDSQIDDLRMLRGDPVAGGSVDVYIETLP